MATVKLQAQLKAQFKSHCNALLAHYKREQIGYLLWHGERELGDMHLRQKLAGEKGTTKGEVAMIMLLRYYHDAIGSLNSLRYTSRGILTAPGFMAEDCAEGSTRAQIYKAQLDKRLSIYEKKDVGRVALLNEQTKQAGNRVYEKAVGLRGVTKFDVSMIMLLVYFHEHVAPLDIIQFEEQVELSSPPVSYFSDDNDVIWFVASTRHSNHPHLLSASPSTVIVECDSADADLLATRTFFLTKSMLSLSDKIDAPAKRFFMDENAVIYAVSEDGRSNCPWPLTVSGKEITVMCPQRGAVKHTLYLSLKRLANHCEKHHVIARTLLEIKHKQRVEKQT